MRLRLIGRLAAVVVGALVFSLVAVQFGRLIHRNLALAAELQSLRQDTVKLQERRAQQLREIARLKDPEGAIPEIHDRLRLMRSNEELIVVTPSAQP